MSAIQSSPLYYFRLVSSTATVTLAGATTNTAVDFNTNIPFGFAMLIRRARVIMARKVSHGLGSYINQILYEVTEDSTRTTVAQTDPFALLDGGYEDSNREATAVGEFHPERNLVMDSFEFDPPHPGVPTVGQQLSLVATGIRVVGADVQSYDVFVQLYYELVGLNENIRTFLSNRIALQRVT